MAIKNPVLKAQVTSFKSDAGFGNQISESDAFEHFCIDAVENGKNRRGVDPDDIVLDDDSYGVDGIAVYINGELADQLSDITIGKSKLEVEISIHQCKASNSRNHGDFLNFLDAAENVLTGKLNKLGSEAKVRTKFIEELFIRHSDRFNKNPSVELNFSSGSTAAEEQLFLNSITEFKTRINKLAMYSTAEVYLPGAQQLQDWHRNVRKDLEGSITIDDAVVLPEVNGVSEGYLGMIRADELVNLSSDEDGNLIQKVFFDNIRAFNSKSKFNLRIGEELRDNPEMFSYKNNGVTIITRSLKRTSNNYMIGGFQIVNGCQTTSILAHNPNYLDKVHVPLRLIATSDEDVINDIIRGTNWQNPVKPEQFITLRDFAKSVETYFSSLEPDKQIFFERRENQYNFSDVAKYKIINVKRLIQCILSFYFKCGNRAGRNYASLRDSHDELFFQNDDSVELYYLPAFIYKRLDELWRSGKLEKTYKKYYLFILTAMGEILLDNNNVFEFYAGASIKERGLIRKEVDGVISFIESDKFDKFAVKVVKSIGKKIFSHLEGSSNIRDALRSSELEDNILKIAKTISKPKFI